MTTPADGDDSDRGAPARKLDCNHGVSFDADDEAYKAGMSAREVRKRWPRLDGACPKGCGFSGIAYASFTHYISGDW